MKRCGTNNSECRYYLSGECNIPDTENCENVVEYVEGFSFYDFQLINNVSDRPMAISNQQSVGRGKRIKQPNLHSISKDGGIWEVFSENLDNCGLNRQEIASANVVYMMNPNEKEPVFILKNRFGPSRFTGMECLLYAINRARKLNLDRVIHQYLGNKWSEVKIS